MIKEQEEAIKEIKTYMHDYIMESFDDDGYTRYEISEEEQEFFNNIEKLLNMIKEQEKEIDILKNKVHYKKCEKCNREFRAKRSDAKYCDECKKNINKEWYKNLSDEQKEKRRKQAKISMRRLRERRKND